MGKPVVASRLPMVEPTFPPGTVATYEPGDARAMAAAIARHRGRPAARARQPSSARAAIVARGGLGAEAEVYVAIVDRLLATERARQ